MLIADDHPLFREGLRAALTAIPDVEVIGEAVDGADAVEQTAELSPDIVVLDLHMPELSGVEACRRIRRSSPEVAVLVLTMVEGDASVAAALRAGAQGYLLKGAERAEIARALDVVGHGGAYHPAALAARVPQLLTHGQSEGHPFPQLTPREREVLHLVGGESVHQVRATCCLHYRTCDDATPDGDRYCTTCPLRSDASRTERLVAHLEATAGR